MSSPELRSLISQLPRVEQEELLRALAGELRSNASHRAPVIDREAWVKNWNSFSRSPPRRNSDLRKKFWTSFGRIGFDA